MNELNTYEMIATYIIDCGLVHCIRDVIGHPPYGHGAREIGGSHE